MSQAYSHNRMPFSNPLRKSLSPKVFPVTAWGRRTGRDTSQGGGLELQLQLTTHIYELQYSDLVQFSPSVSACRYQYISLIKHIGWLNDICHNETQ